MIPRPRRIGHVGLVARDLERMVRFYCEVIGMQVSDRMSFPETSPIRDGVWLRIGTDHHVLSMFDLRDGAEAPTAQDSYPLPSHGLHHMAFEMASFEDLRRAARVVREQQIPLQGMRTGGPGCQLRLYLWDPEGNIIELYWALDQIGWDGRARPYPPVETINLESVDVDSWLEWKGAEFASAPLGAPAGRA
ncbi:MAG: VOC family protein [Actinobacteria bacterium]|nr:VOC family protein [Actinomycetota bacterium]